MVEYLACIHIQKPLGMYNQFQNYKQENGGFNF